MNIENNYFINDNLNDKNSKIIHIKNKSSTIDLTTFKSDITGSFFKIIVGNENYFVSQSELKKHGFKPPQENKDSIKISDLLNVIEKINLVKKNLISKRIDSIEAQKIATYVAGNPLNISLEEGYFKKDENHAFTIESYKEGAFLLLKEKHSIDPNLSPFRKDGGFKKVTMAISLETGAVCAHSVINLSALSRDRFLNKSQAISGTPKYYLKTAVESELKNKETLDESYIKALTTIQSYDYDYSRISMKWGKSNLDLDDLFLLLVEKGRNLIKNEIEVNLRADITKEIHYLQKFGDIKVIANGEHKSESENIVRDKDLNDTLITIITPLAKGTGRDFSKIHTTPAAIQKNMCALAESLKKMHQEGVIHEDIKPENILLFPEAKLADFGLSREINETKGVRGTQPYYSPEKLIGVSQNPKGDDLFALGLSFLEMLPDHQDVWRQTLNLHNGSIDKALAELINNFIPQLKVNFKEYAVIYETIETIFNNYSSMSAEEVVKLLSAPS